ncbi:MAG: xanthine dehydrogenase family protein molybdopterin-binding subunit [Nevskiaceae bacterium]|nr:MAG: xanthine dehydrogenase family protein molybdopterin-binding subunit [Nevskiaceae bacterium]TBR71319.1 MAG: xanthine dehydrogenase family protein molybdopterin-binding subunit [Nevskiaceae bacterium]
MNTTLAMTRRDLLLAGLKAGGALVVGFPLSGMAANAAAQGVGKPKDFGQVDAWLAIDHGGRVTLYSGHVELGTGVETAFMQMVAEELDVPFQAITVVQGDTLLTPDQGPTWGSLSVQVAGQQLRKAAACARRALLRRAARKLGAEASALVVKDGVVSGGTGTVTYGALAASGALAVAFDDAVPLKAPKGFRIVGKPVARVDIPAKMTGEFTYMQDFTLPGMLHGRVIRPTGMQAHLQSVDDGAARRLPGFVKTVVKGDFVGVVARTEWGAIKAMRAVKCVWSDWRGLPPMDTIYDHTRHAPQVKTEVVKTEGDVSISLADAAKVLKATYEFPVQTHGSIGPSCAVADVRPGAVQIWSASQSTHWMRRQIAVLLGVDAGTVRVRYLEGAGCYGRNGHEDAAADAVLLSRAVGAPVRVQWMRADEHGWDPKSPPYVTDMQGAVDANGNLVAWDFETWFPYFVPGGWKHGAPVNGVPLLAGSLMHDTAGVQVPARQMSGYGEGNTWPEYAIPNLHATIHWLRTTPFRPSWLRGPGWAQNTFTNESFMDEFAAAAGVDPVAFRLKHLKDERGTAVIRACAQRAGWQARPSPAPHTDGRVARGRGFAYVFYDNKRTYVAAACEVEVDRKTGKVRATRFTIAHDCGLTVNPDGAKAQIEGSVVQTLSRTLIEEVKWDAAHVTSLDWASYPIVTFPDVPAIDIVLLDRPEAPAWGVGEPTCSVVPPALSNAIFDAVGVRMRRAPFTPERVRQALSAAQA